MASSTSYPGARIAQLTLERLGQPALAEDGETQKYTATVRPHPSRLPAERDELERLAGMGTQLRSRLG